MFTSLYTLDRPLIF